MKKKLALLMVISVLLGSAGCSSSKKKEETKKRKTEETEETETTTETKDDPVSRKTQSDVSVTIEYDLNCYTMNHSYYRRSYGAPQSRPDGRGLYPMHSVSLRLGRVCFEENALQDPRFQTIQDKLDEQFDEIEKEYEKAYQKAADEFASYEEEGVDLFDANWYSDVTVYRSDDEITSVFFDTSFRAFKDREKKRINGNFRTEDASLIRFDEVVKDRDAIRDYISENVSLSKESILEELDEEEPIYTISYDGIFFPKSNVKVPAFGGLEYAFDLRYFTRAPYTYILDSNPDDTLTWDFDGDGQMETLTFREEDIFKPSGIIITLGDEEYKITKDMIPALEKELVVIMPGVLFTDNMAFVIIRVDDGANAENYYVHLPPGEIQVMAAYEPFLTERYNPYSILSFYKRGIIGETFIYPLLTFDGAVPESYGGWCEAKTAIMVVKKDLPGKEFNYSTETTGADTTLKTGMKIETVLYNEDTFQIVVKVLDPDESKNRYILLETDPDQKTVAGVVPSDDLFDGFKRYG